MISGFLKGLTLRLFPKKKVLLYFYMVQDLDILLPLAVELKKANVTPICFVTWQMLKKSKRIVKELERHNLSWETQILPRYNGGKFSIDGYRPLLEGVSAVVTAVETSAVAHRHGHGVVKRAKAKKIPTYTFQHGFENIGLTYFDNEFPPGSISILSDRVFTWCPNEKLSDSIQNDILQKCVAVGCTKEYSPPTIPPNEIFASAKQLIVVFENLHWARYTDSYRRLFLEGLETAAAKNPNCIFIVKPHHAGKWLTERYNGEIPTQPNIVIANPSDPNWEPFTAPSLIGCADIVITTPSTVALDAAIMNVPVAVVKNDLDLRNYEPLHLLAGLDAWDNLCKQIETPNFLTSLQERGRKFVEENCVSLQGAVAAVKTIEKDLFQR